MLKDIRCGNCKRLLARAAGISQLQIKCSRCGTLNHVKTLSLELSSSSDKESDVDRLTTQPNKVII
ncbi:Com family DNA-binding transcriptional regulator [Pseudomonas fulva]|uniref:zinc finger domain-containing protein n=1 Tax=Pseudomonas fulva TaxID=47880 RepID=UPI0018AAE6C9|nr:Com family DNA-binding transcriptional regulator [Pseudomonas fulva]MBF8636059.1 Com family DNA-binding transcriptional regulator [Pseudomonas fulva]MBF8688088.1 Com family DNA-binding transcriptional regulator [Pseudomonas fulva]